MALSIRTRLTLWYTGILLSILVVISGLSYSLLRSRLIQDLDASLLAVGQVVRDTGWSGSGAAVGGRPESALREILGPEFYDKFFQLVDPEGRPGTRSPHLREETLPLSAQARSNAARGAPTVETVRLATGEPVRLLTLPITRDGQLVQLVQVGIPLHRAQRTLGRYVETLLVLIPLGLALAALGGGMIARAALRPVDAMSRTARRISGEDLHARLSLRGTGDELDHLAETLNAMLTRLGEAFVQMRRFTADAAHVADARGVTVVLKERTPAVVTGDAVALRRAVLKLVENAVKYTPRGGRVELALRLADGRAEVLVTDTGIGMDPADVERIFEPFVRLDAARARDTGGAGLGLPIARSIVATHGGTLAAESVPSAGSTFTIRLPIA